LQGDMLQKIGY